MNPFTLGWCGDDDSLFTIGWVRNSVVIPATVPGGGRLSDKDMRDFMKGFFNDGDIDDIIVILTITQL